MPGTDQILPPVPFLRLTLQLLLVSPALDRIHGPSAIHLEPRPYVADAFRGGTSSVDSGDGSLTPPRLNGPRVLLAIMSLANSKESVGWRQTPMTGARQENHAVIN